MPAGLVRECDGVATTADANYAGRRHDEPLLDPRRALDVLRRRKGVGWGNYQPRRRTQRNPSGVARPDAQRSVGAVKRTKLECPGVSALQLRDSGARTGF